LLEFAAAEIFKWLSSQDINGFFSLELGVGRANGTAVALERPGV
jgi:hypothetical protein